MKKFLRLKSTSKVKVSVPGSLLKKADIQVFNYQINLALHRAAFMNSYELVSVLIEEMSKRVGEDRISKFVNKPTDHGFRAIHYASYKGNVDAIKLLMTYGADVHMKTKKGLNVLHLAAQGDQPSSLVYFMEKFKFNFNAEDRYGSTILHWACFAGAEYVFDLIISNYSQSLDLNKQDKEGLTPLHLSVISGNYFNY